MRKPKVTMALLVAVSLAAVSMLVWELDDRSGPIDVAAANGGNTLYVGGAGPDNYSSIQAAIDNATAGDTVYVYNGTYYENVVVDKAIVLMGEDRNHTFIDGQLGEKLDVVTIYANDVHIKDLTIQGGNKSDGGSVGYGIKITSDDCNISHNNITTNDNHAILLSGANNNTIYKNDISHNARNGIWFTGHSDNNDISHNVLIDNSWTGIGGAYDSANNTICDNHISGSGNGIMLERTSGRNTIHNNTVSDCSDAGILLVRGNNGTVFSNHITGCQFGVEFWSTGNNTVKENRIRDSERGIYIHMYSSEYPNHNNTIAANTILYSTQYGIYVTDGENATGNLFYHNNLINNDIQAHDEGNNTWDDGYPTGGNYWSDFDEPFEGAYDAYSGVNQDAPGSDGIVDGGSLNPYTIPGGYNQDQYPLTKPWIYPLPPDMPVYNLYTGETFATLQGAIDDGDTLDGHTIIVSPDTYVENIAVDKRLMIQSMSENPEDTIIKSDGQISNIVTITADGAALSGFTLQDASSMNQNVRGLYISYADNCTISDVIIRNVTAIYNATINHYAYGAMLKDSHNNTFSNVTIEGINGQDYNAMGIQVGANANGNIFSETYVHNVTANVSAYGITIGSNSHNNTITYTIIHHIGTQSGYGISVSYSENTTITDSRINNVTGSGLNFIDTAGNTIASTYISNNTGYGLFMFDATASHISSCNIYNNSLDGIRLRGTTHSTISTNTIHDNNATGIYLYDGSDHNTVSDNHAYNNTEHGIYLRTSDYNVVRNCNASFNRGSGFALYYSEYNQIHDNVAVYNDDTSRYYNAGSGIFLYESNYDDIHNNSLRYNDAPGIQLYRICHDNTITDNEARYNDEGGIVLYGGSNPAVFCNSNLLSGNIASHNVGSGINFGYTVGGGSDNDILGNTLYGNTENGIHLGPDSENNTIQACISYNNAIDGISIAQGKNNIIQDTLVYGNDQYGINMFECFGGTVVNNTAHGHTNHSYSAGIIADHTTSSTILDNEVYANSRGLYIWSSTVHAQNNYAYMNDYGLYLGNYAYNSTITANVVTNNTMYGIEINSVTCNGNLIYNNYFNNTNNARDNGINIWNTTKTTGESILGGVSIGGNFWHDYQGEDTDADDLGDTLLPYTPDGRTSGGDYHPLLYPSNHPPATPAIGGPSSGYTDASLTFTATATDPNDDHVRYGFDWDNDGTVDIWTSLQPSGTSVGTSYSWDTAGQYSIRVIAEDEHGLQSGWSDIRTVTISVYIPPNQPPTVNITSPSGNAVVSGIETIQGTASDSDGVVASVSVKIDDGAWQDATGTTAWSYVWNTTAVDNGNHTITTRSYDDDDYSSIATIDVVVFNNHPPTVTIISPTDGAIINGTVLVNGTMSDPDGVDTIQQIQIKIGDGNWTSIPYNLTVGWQHLANTTAYENGEYSLQVRVYDGAAYSNVAAITVTIDNEDEDGDGTPGFELFICLVALWISLGLLRRRKQ